MRHLLLITCLLAVSSLANSYSKYGRTCVDIGCTDSEECVLQEDVCTLASKGHCGTYPTCKKANKKQDTCALYVCPSSQTCKLLADGTPTCVKSANSIPIRFKRQSYNPSAPAGDTPTSSNSQSIYPQLRDSTPSAPTQSRRATTERANTYRIAGSYPTQPSGGTPYQNPGYQGYPGGQQNQGNPGYPGYQNQGYPGYQNQNQGYNPGYQNQGYPGYQNQNPGYNQGVPNQGYPGYNQNQGYQNQGYNQNPGYQNPGYQNPRYQNPGYQNPGYQNPGYPGQSNYPPGYNPQGGYDYTSKKPGVLDPILDTLTKTVTQLGANYLRDKLFNNNKPKQTP